MLEHRKQPVLPRGAFYGRLARAAAFSFVIVTGSIALGVLGYRVLAGLSWIDALLNTCMLLGGMGPVDELRTTAAKLFASFFALYSGLVFLVAAGVLFFPLYHRFIHRFHLEFEEERDTRAGRTGHAANPSVPKPPRREDGRPEAS